MYETTHQCELTESITANLVLRFACVSPGYRSTWECPGEPPEFEIREVGIEEVWANDDSWIKGGEEDLGDWTPIVQALADNVDEADGLVFDDLLEAYQECH